MDLSQRTETFGQDDASWLGSDHGTSMARSITLDVSAFTAATHYPDGYFPSGLPLGQITASGKYGPFTADATDGTQTLAGFLLTSVDAPDVNTTDVVGALLDHGRVIVDRLPVDFDPADATAPSCHVIFA